MLLPTALPHVRQCCGACYECVEPLCGVQMLCCHLTLLPAAATAPPPAVAGMCCCLLLRVTLTLLPAAATLSGLLLLRACLVACCRAVTPPYTHNRERRSTQCVPWQACAAPLPAKGCRTCTHTCLKAAWPSWRQGCVWVGLGISASSLLHISQLRSL